MISKGKFKYLRKLYPLQHYLDVLDGLTSTRYIVAGSMGLTGNGRHYSSRIIEELAKTSQVCRNYTMAVMHPSKFDAVISPKGI